MNRAVLSALSMRPTSGSRLPLSLLTTLVVWSCVRAPVAAAETPPPARPLNVLFIGNSYTYNNNLPALVEGLAASATPPQRPETGPNRDTCGVGCSISPKNQ